MTRLDDRVSNDLSSRCCTHYNPVSQGMVSKECLSNTLSHKISELSKDEASINIDWLRWIDTDWHLFSFNKVLDLAFVNEKNCDRTVLSLVKSTVN